MASKSELRHGTDTVPEVNEIPPEIDYSEHQEKACPVSNFLELISISKRSN